MIIPIVSASGAKSSITIPDPVVSQPGDFPFVQTAAAKFGWGTPTRVDQFDQKPSSATGWNVYDGPGHAGNGRRTPTAVSASGGIMTITGDTAGNSGGMGWGSGQLYGRWEIAMKTAAGSGNYHPVMLLWPIDGGGGTTAGGTGGEIDFCEIFRPDRSQANFFLHPGDGTQLQGSANVDCTQWHAWALEWTPTKMTAYCDGNVWWTSTDPSKFPKGPMGLCLQLDNFGGDISAGGRMDFAWAKQWALPSNPTTPVPTGVPGNWVLAFNDDFDGTTLDATKWRQLGWGTNNVTSSMANVAVSNSNLVLTLANSTSGAILTTQPGGSTTGFKIGAECVWEARILFPGDGSHIYGWPAFWLLNDASGDVLCEIDIAEPWDGVMQTNYHCSGSNPSKSYTGYRDGQFHIWTMRRTTTQMLFYVDGQLVYTLPKAAADNGHPQYCIINTGRTNSGLYNVYGAASQVKVDYVRAWKPA